MTTIKKIDLLKLVIVGASCTTVTGLYGGFGYIRHGHLDRVVIALQVVVVVALGLIPNLISTSFPSTSRKVLSAIVESMAMATWLSLLVLFGGFWGAIINGVAGMILFHLSDHVAKISQR